MQARAWLNALRDAPRKKPLPVLSFPCVSLLNITVKDLIADSGLQAEGMRRVAERVDAAGRGQLYGFCRWRPRPSAAAIRVTDDEVPTVTGAVVDLGGRRCPPSCPFPRWARGAPALYVEAMRKAACGAHHRPARVRRGHRALLPGGPPDGRHRGHGAAAMTEPELVHYAMRESATEFLTAYVRRLQGGPAPTAWSWPSRWPACCSPESWRRVLRRPMSRGSSTRCRTTSSWWSTTTAATIPMASMIDSIVCHRRGGLPLRQRHRHGGHAAPSSRPTRSAMGNVDPGRAVPQRHPGRPCAEDTLALMDACCHGYPNFVLSSGCDIPPTDPLGEHRRLLRRRERVSTTASKQQTPLSAAESRQGRLHDYVPGACSRLAARRGRNRSNSQAIKPRIRLISSMMQPAVRYRGSANISTTTGR